MKKSYKFIIWYLNTSGVLNLTSSGSKLEVSKLAVIFNALTFPLIFCLGLSMPLSVYKENIRESENFFKEVSVFMISSMITVNFQYTFIAFWCVYISIWKRQKIVLLVQKCVITFHHFQVSSSSEEFKELERKCLKTVCLTFAVAASVKVLGYFVSYKTSWASFYLVLVSEWFEGIVLPFFALSGIFLFYFSFLLRNLKMELERIDSKTSLDCLASKFSNLFNNVTEFNEVFGLLLTLTAVFAISITTFRVRIWRQMVLDDFHHF